MDNDEPNSLGREDPVVHARRSEAHAPHAGRGSSQPRVNNLFDEKYYNYAVRSQFVLDRYNAYPLPERNGMVSVEYQFR